MAILTDFDETYALVDSNQKVSAGVLQPDGDEFGAAIDALWDAQAGPNPNPYAEGGGLQSVAYSFNNWKSIIRHNTVKLLKDCDIVVVENTSPAVAGYSCYISLQIGKDLATPDNFIILQYKARGTINQRYIYAAKYINGVSTILYANTNIGNITPLYLRIKRRRTSGPSPNYFDIYWSANGIAWNSIFSGQVRDAVHFNETQDLSFGHTDQDDGSVGAWAHTTDRYYQETSDLAAQIFWTDSPEIRVIAAPGVDYAADAGLGLTYDPRYFAHTATQPGTSAIKYKLGTSATGVEAAVAWIDGVWQTEAQVLANCVAGAYDGKRYVHIKAQFNSDGTDQPSLTSVTLLRGAVPAGTKAHHDRMRRIKYGWSRIP